MASQNKGETPSDRDLELSEAAGEPAPFSNFLYKENAFSHLIDGAIGGFVAGLLLQPLQVIKTAMQVPPIEIPAEQMKLQKNLKFLPASKLIYQREGFLGYYRGLKVAVVKATLASGIYFYFLNLLTTSLKRSFNDSVAYFMAASTTRLLQTIMINPVVVIKQRIEMIGFKDYSGILDAVTKIWAKEGIKGYTHGLGVSIIRDVPFSGIYYPIYMQCMKLATTLADGNGIEGGKLIGATVFSATLATIASCVITQPLDIIRTRLLVKFYNQDKAQHYTGIMHAMKKIYEKEGVVGFTRGLTPRIMRKGLGNILAWSTYEYLVGLKRVRIE